MQTKYIFITGGVVSSIGKGITASSIGTILEARGFSVDFIKFDPYINVDPGTMSPFQHGEVYVTEDGAETDLDLGHYERFTSITTSKLNNYTTGKIYQQVIEKERKGEYLGSTVQIIPHITDEIKNCIKRISEEKDIIIVEIGGTVGDIESLPFLEAIRQFRQEVGRGNSINIHVTLVPFIKSAHELKTKPTQHSVKELQSIGIQPDIIICRSEKTLPSDVKEKIALFCNVPKNCVIGEEDAELIYEVPLQLIREGLDEQILDLLNLSHPPKKIKKWEEMVYKIKNPKDKVKIGIVGKYTKYGDSYKSLIEALVHGGIANDLAVEIVWIDSEDFEKGKKQLNILKDIDGVLVPGGFGERGKEGKIKAIKFIRENKIPFFGICLGLQTAIIEFSRNVAGLSGADSTEFNECAPHKVIVKLPELLSVGDLGGTMRLGSYVCIIKEDSLAFKIYGKKEITERHRHRYEVNTQYREKLEKAGLTFSGESPDKVYIEIIELKDHPFFIAVQFHPEFKSRPLNPHPLFKSFVEASHINKKGKIDGKK